MPSNKTLSIEKDLLNKQLRMIRQFDAGIDLVWRAWTEKDLLDLWWAPDPWRTETQSMDFREGGHWLYAMVGPDNTRHWSKVDFHTIVPQTSITSSDCFCDEIGNPIAALPAIDWQVKFIPQADVTQVHVVMSFREEADLMKILAMGFEAGFSSALTNLDRYIETQFNLRKQMKTDTRSRVTTYLNFPGNTEEAFNFYKTVFGGQFTGNGLTRFGDIEMPEGTPPLSEADKKLIIHAELTILGGHVLMATDAPESMGFTVVQGNNMHINLEPASKEETRQLFDRLAEGGIITMPLSDMFWGAYFGSLKDRFGINWMFNFSGK